MRAAVIDRFGGPEVFRLSNRPVPDPRIGGVLVRVVAVGVNAIDWKTRSGQGCRSLRSPQSSAGTLQAKLSPPDQKLPASR
jgi:NADPH:quinone reductase-like Zn-dependent oxidoreductase